MFRSDYDSDYGSDHHLDALDDLYIFSTAIGADVAAALHEGRFDAKALSAAAEAGEPTWDFGSCEEELPYVCEQTNACPDFTRAARVAST